MDRGCFHWIAGREAIRRAIPRRRDQFPIIIRCDHDTGGVIQSQNRIGQCSGYTGVDQGWTQGAQGDLFGFSTRNDETADQRIITRADIPRVEKLSDWPYDWESRIFQMNRDGVVGGVTKNRRILIVKNLFSRRVQA